MHGNGGDTFPFSPGSGTTERWDLQTGIHTIQDGGFAGGEESAPTAGLYNFNFTASANDHWTAVAVEVKALYSDITTSAGIGDAGGAFGIAWEDYDNDGHLDLWIADYADGSSVLYNNNGDGTFTASGQGSTGHRGGNWVDADQSTGRIIHIPNGIVFNKWQANYTAGFEYIWNEIPVLVTFESDWKKAKEILLEAVNKHAVHLSAEAEKQIKVAAKKFLIFYNKLTPIVYTSVKDCGVMLTIRFLCHVRRRRATDELIWEEVLEQFAKHDDIDFAYPTTRFYNNIGEGKEGTKPPMEK